MTPDEVQAALDRFTYRPGYTFTLEVDHDFFGQPIFTVIIDGEQIAPHRLKVPEWTRRDRPQDFYQLLASELHRIEWAETDEWIKVDGVPLFDPHRKMTS